MWKRPFFAVVSRTIFLYVLINFLWILIDGIAVFNSRNKAFWPLLASFINTGLYGMLKHYFQFILSTSVTYTFEYILIVAIEHIPYLWTEDPTVFPLLLAYTPFSKSKPEEIILIFFILKLSIWNVKIVKAQVFISIVLSYSGSSFFVYLFCGNRCNTGKCFNYRHIYSYTS